MSVSRKLLTTYNCDLCGNGRLEQKVDWAPGLTAPHYPPNWSVLEENDRALDVCPDCTNAIHHVGRERANADTKSAAEEHAKKSLTFAPTLAVPRK
jgi:predicted RNA-binding Zn-ribbon protein involved in translation (DUF1610 family)